LHLDIRVSILQAEVVRTTVELDQQPASEESARTRQGIPLLPSPSPDPVTPEQVKELLESDD